MHTVSLVIFKKFFFLFEGFHLDLSGQQLLNDSCVCKLLRIYGNTLTTLNLNLTNITGEIRAGSSLKMKKLEHLNISQCKHVKDKGLLKILSITGTQLKYLNIGQTNITGEMFALRQHNFSKMENLNMSGCSNLTDRGLLNLLRSFGQQLKYLDLSDTNITWEGLALYKKALSNLERLNLHGCTNLTVRCLKDAISVSIYNLTSLDLSNTNITGEELDKFTLNIPNLMILNLRNCKKLTDKGLFKVLNMIGHQLKSLDLSDTNITAEQLIGMNMKIPMLQSLNLSNCKELTDKGLAELLKISALTFNQIDLAGTNTTAARMFEDLMNSNVSFSGTLSTIVNMDNRNCFQVEKEDLAGTNTDAMTDFGMMFDDTMNPSHEKYPVFDNVPFSNGTL